MCHKWHGNQWQPIGTEQVHHINFTDICAGADDDDEKCRIFEVVDR